MKLSSRSGTLSVDIPKLGTFIVIPEIDGLNVECNQEYIKSTLTGAEKDRDNRYRSGYKKMHLEIDLGNGVSRTFVLQGKQLKNICKS